MAFGFVAPYLLIEGVEQLLAGGGPGKRGAMIKGAAETAVIEQTFGRAVEHHTHAVEQIDDAGRGFAHAPHERLIGKKIAAENRVVEMFSDGVAFAFLIFRGVDAALGANGM